MWMVRRRSGFARSKLIMESEDDGENEQSRWEES